MRLRGGENRIGKLKNDGGKREKYRTARMDCFEKRRLERGPRLMGTRKRDPGSKRDQEFWCRGVGRQPERMYEAGTSRNGDRERLPGCENPCDLPDGLPHGRAGFDSPPGPL